MITNQNEIDDYFATDKFDTDETVLIKNDKVLLKLFLSAVITKITNKSPSSISFSPKDHYAWRTRNEQYTVGTHSFESDKEKSDEFCLELNYVGGSLSVKRDSSGCVYLSGNKMRKSIKVSPLSLTIRPKWVTPLILTKFVEAQKVEIDKKIMTFQNELLVPYLTQKLIDRGIPEDKITSERNRITIPNLGSKHWWSSVCIYPVNDTPTEEMEDRLWCINIHKTYISNVKFSSVIDIIGALQDSALFK